MKVNICYKKNFPNNIDMNTKIRESVQEGKSVFCGTEPVKIADRRLAKPCIKMMIMQTHSPVDKYCKTDRLLRRVT